jgi:hypothetical protein
MSDEAPYNPLDKRNLGASVAEALLEQDPHPLDSLPKPFEGAGVYAIYYHGDFPAYAELAKRNRDGRFEAPIYVGKADAEGGRKGGLGLDAKPGRPLFKRLNEHAKSVREAENLEIADFSCRFLTVEPIFVALGESLLIATFSPIWNKLVDGFGNHDPGGGRRQGMCPRWDVLHPGRSWAHKMAKRPETADQIAEEVRTYIHTAPRPRKLKLHRPGGGETN